MRGEERRGESDLTGRSEGRKLGEKVNEDEEGRDESHREVQ